MDEQTVEGIADGNAARLGIQDDSLAHLQVALFVKVGVHHAGTRLDDRNAGGVAYKVDKPSTATWYAEVYIPHGIQ